MADGKKQYWESPEEIEKIMKRREIRHRLQQEFNRINYNPYRMQQHIELLDPAISRYSAMRASIYEHWKPNWRGFWKWSFVSYIPIVLMAYRLTGYMQEVNADCRTGAIPYERREFRRI
ncbi:NADH dehydrogenase (ubiquinone) B15 subunit [Dermatophagoides farinae]|uniref:NADH dehydrogenase [ubiquinone] 1 beta subcomplex subunit 4 n=1 Tax=Dermatophagoides farinae TaxID=6954 RepID=A0A922IAI3_DERFA|nr:uncharacterized protein LOC124492328 [Dermatophagoides farinae]KAH7641432.1 hypothetical protein HUG17_4476 [Dermatophagoides farinae]KAH9527237.1 hypothetical protein DERF_001268 [Dermatophagoides farinae]